MTDTITAWPAHTTEPAPVPLPNLGRCADCGGEIRIRGNGRLYAHDCTGDGQLPLVVLKPTFARWLWTQSKKRDDYTNLATLVAGRHFRSCTRSPKITAADVDWTTAEDLHQRLHLTQLARTGSELMRTNGERCGGACRDLQKIAAIYERLMAGADPAISCREDVALGPTVRVFRNSAGWVMRDFTDLEQCTTNHIPANAGQLPCTGLRRVEGRRGLRHAPDHRVLVRRPLA